MGYFRGVDFMMLKCIIYILFVSQGLLAAKKDNVPLEQNSISNGLSGNKDGKDKSLAFLGHQYSLLNRTGCMIYPKEGVELRQKIRTLVDASTKLLEYNILFPEYDTNPLDVKKGDYYKPNAWYRAFESHGEALLSLSFNYKLLSLSTLSLGVERMQVEVMDSPKGCFGNVSADDKMGHIMELVLSDFRPADDNRQWIGTIDLACHHIMYNHSGTADFQYRCCKRKGEDEPVYCDVDISNYIIEKIMSFLLALKVLAILFGPIILARVIYSASLYQKMYTVWFREDDELRKTVLIQGKGTQNATVDIGRSNRFSNLKRNASELSGNKRIVTFKTLELEVDHRELMTEKCVPVSLTKFLYKQLFKCEVKYSEPFKTCCHSGIWGSKSVLKNDGDGDVETFRPWRDKKRQFGKCTWAGIAPFISGLILMILSFGPFSLRVFLYYEYEESELLQRKQAASERDLQYSFGGLIHQGDPLRHPLWITFYCIYILSFLYVLILRRIKKHEFDLIGVNAVQDLRDIKRVECFRMVFAHFIFPLEQFGIFGILIGIPYWIAVLPSCLLVTIFYCVPSFYLFGRLIVHRRPYFGFEKEKKDSKNGKSPCPPCKDEWEEKRKHTVSKWHFRSLERFFHLQNISYQKRIDYGTHTEISTSGRGCCKNTEKYFSIFAGFGLAIFMVCTLIMSFDVLAFLIEAFVFGTMGAIVNEEHLYTFLTFAFSGFLYAYNIFNEMNARYMELNQNIFSCVKNKIQTDQDIMNIIRLDDEEQGNNAFKFFKKSDLEKHNENKRKFRESLPENKKKGDGGNNLTDFSCGHRPDDDTLIYEKKKLRWLVHSLVLFIDKHDVPRIPKALFEKICSIDIKGAPGPVHKSVLYAFRQVCYPVIFLVFFFFCVEAFGHAFNLSATSKIALSMAGGLLPWAFKKVATSAFDNMNLNTYSYEGKLHEVIHDFKQAWPVHDLTFTVDQEPMVISTDPDFKFTVQNNLPDAHTDKMHMVIFSRHQDQHQPSTSARLQDDEMLDIEVDDKEVLLKKLHQQEEHHNSMNNYDRYGQESNNGFTPISNELSH